MIRTLVANGLKVETIINSTSSNGLLEITKKTALFHLTIPVHQVLLLVLHGNRESTLSFFQSRLHCGFIHAARTQNFSKN